MYCLCICVNIWVIGLWTLGTVWKHTTTQFITERCFCAENIWKLTIWLDLFNLAQCGTSLAPYFLFCLYSPIICLLLDIKEWQFLKTCFHLHKISISWLKQCKQTKERRTSDTWQLVHLSNCLFNIYFYPWITIDKYSYLTSSVPAVFTWGHIDVDCDTR